MELEHRIQRALNKKIEEGSFRQVWANKGIDFCSNHYMGAQLSKAEWDDIAQTALNYNPYGSGGSRLISGTHPIHLAFEEYLSITFNSQAALIFNSGYDANLGFWSCIPQRGDLIIYDQLCHASIRDGIQLSRADKMSFKHNDLVQLEDCLKRSVQTCFVAIESIYSMDGDLAPLEEIAVLCAQYGAALVVDEAHAVGVWGSGLGCVQDLELEGNVFARLLTFGKAIGAHGAAWLCSEACKNFLINHARSFIFTTSLPPLDIAITQALCKKVLADDGGRKKLQQQVSYFRDKLNGHPALLPSLSAIQGYLCPGNEAVVSLSQSLAEAGIHCKAIRYPTVAKGAERLRIIIHTFNSIKEIDHLTQHLIDHETAKNIY